MNTPKLQLYGLEMLDKFDLRSARKEFNYDFELSDENIKTFVKELLHQECDDIVIVRKELPRVGLKFHIDDCQLITMKKPPTYNLDCYIHLEDSKYLFFQKKIPKYTILFYNSTFGVEFDGGILGLADDVRIKPVKGLGVLLDSREAHMVTPVTRGVRATTVVKVY